MMMPSNNFRLLFVSFILLTLSNTNEALHDHDAAKGSSHHKKINNKNKFKDYPKTYRKGKTRLNSHNEVPRAMFSLDYDVFGDTAKDKADYFLKNNRHLLKLKEEGDDDGNKHELRYVSDRKTAIWTTVRYQQYYSGIEVYKADLVVTINDETNKVKIVTGNYQRGIDIDDVAKTFVKYTEDDLFDDMSTKYAKSSGGGGMKHYNSKMVLVHRYGKSNVAWHVKLTPENSYQTNEILVDARSGEIMKEEDITLDSQHSSSRRRNRNNDKVSSLSSSSLRRGNQLADSSNTREHNNMNQNLKESRSLEQRVNGLGYVFDPDPISTGRGKYGNSGFEDSNDMDSATLRQQLIEVTLNDITLKNNQYFLSGPYAEIVDTDGPFDGVFEQANSDFRHTRSHDSFEAVNCYYHIDHLMRYINEDLGIDLMPYQYNTGVKCDPHAANGDDNSYYDQADGIVNFGEGGVDDAEDPDVILHELAHGIHDWLTRGGLSQVNGLSEGFGDYIANSYSRSKGHFTADDEEYYWIFKWDGHNEFWGGRTTNYQVKYPNGLVGQIHRDGQIWSSCNMKIWEAIGREKSDKIHLIGLSATSSGSDQEDTANAILEAAHDLNYDTEDIEKIVEIYAGCGYEVTNDVCGDGIVGVSEECDGDDIGGATCAANGCLGEGTPTCTSSCTLEYSDCKAGDDQFEFRFDLQTDEYGVETFWSLTNPEGTQILYGGPFGSLQSYTEVACLPIPERDEDCYVFELLDTAGDGICCNFGEGDFSLFVNDVEDTCTDPVFVSSSKHDICPNNWPPGSCEVQEYCGDGIIQENEVCDSDVINGASCADRQCYGGTPTCNIGCTGINYSECTNCFDAESLIQAILQFLITFIMGRF